MSKGVPKIEGHCWGDSIESVCWGGGGCHGGCGVILTAREGKWQRITWDGAYDIIGGTGQDPRLIYELLKKLDFVAAVDLFMTPMAILSDVVLPSVTFAERNSVTGKAEHPDLE